MNIHLTLHDGTPETVRTDTAVSGNCTVGFRAYRYGASPIRLRPDVGLPDMADCVLVNGVLDQIAH